MAAHSLIEEVIRRVSGFRMPLRGEEPAVFDDMMTLARRYAGAADSLRLPVTNDNLILTLLFAHHKQLKELEERNRHFGNNSPGKESQPHQELAR